MDVAAIFQMFHRRVAATLTDVLASAPKVSSFAQALAALRTTDCALYEAEATDACDVIVQALEGQTSLQVAYNCHLNCHLGTVVDLPLSLPCPGSGVTLSAGFRVFPSGKFLCALLAFKLRADLALALREIVTDAGAVLPVFSRPAAAPESAAVVKTVMAETVAAPESVAVVETVTAPESAVVAETVTASENVVVTIGIVDTAAVPETLAPVVADPEVADPETVVVAVTADILDPAAAFATVDTTLPTVPAAVPASAVASAAIPESIVPVPDREYVFKVPDCVALEAKATVPECMAPALRFFETCHHLVLDKFLGDAVSTEASHADEMAAAAALADPNVHFATYESSDITNCDIVLKALDSNCSISAEKICDGDVHTFAASLPCLGPRRIPGAVFHLHSTGSFLCAMAGNTVKVQLDKAIKAVFASAVRDFAPAPAAAPTCLAKLESEEAAILKDIVKIVDLKTLVLPEGHPAKPALHAYLDTCLMHPEDSTCGQLAELLTAMLEPRSYTRLSLATLTGEEVSWLMLKICSPSVSEQKFAMRAAHRLFTERVPDVRMKHAAEIITSAAASIKNSDDAAVHRHCWWLICFFVRRLTSTDAKVTALEGILLAAEAREKPDSYTISFISQEFKGACLCWGFTLSADQTASSPAQAVRLAKALHRVARLHRPALSWCQADRACRILVQALACDDDDDLEAPLAVLRMLCDTGHISADTRTPELLKTLVNRTAVASKFVPEALKLMTRLV